MPKGRWRISLLARIGGFLRRRPVTEVSHAPSALPGSGRGPVEHVIVLDGTMSSLDEGATSNAGHAYRLIAEGSESNRRTLYYEEGSQWQGWRHGMALIDGRGLDAQILRAYGYLASQYREGDRIFLFGYSRGAYAVRSLAGMIDSVGLLSHRAATERNVHLAWRHYRMTAQTPASREFRAAHCYPQTPIEMIGVWDTVKSLGLQVPLLWRFTASGPRFHNHHLSSVVRHGFHALALDETRVAFTPEMWICPPGWEGNIEQVWFRGAHGDIGGQLGNFEAARPLANIPLVWMLERAEACGLALPEGWRARFTCDATVPMVGTWRGWGMGFLHRRRRVIGQDLSERLHESVPEASRRRWPMGRR